MARGVCVGWGQWCSGAVVQRGGVMAPAASASALAAFLAAFFSALARSFSSSDLVSPMTERRVCVGKCNVSQ